ncbi:MAG: FtsQ-type POTRA domain-containing protein [Pseudoclavibacter sp.]|nr:FtsQ-type POTRA domain-containing protein [Pseudoclavibacter sp.]
MRGERAAERAEREAERARLRAARAEIRRFTRGSETVRRRLLIASGVLGALLLFVAVAAFSPLMSVRDIRVEGTVRLQPAEVASALSDLRGRPLASVTEEQVGERVRDFVLVQSYASHAEPPGALVVRIVERQAIGAIAGPDGHRVYDAARVELWQEPQPPGDVPLLELEGGLEGERFDAAAGVSLALPADFRARVQRITARSRDDVEFVLRDGAVVRWGSAEGSSRKVEVLFALMRAAEGRSVAVYDVSSPESPVTR